MPNGVFIKGGRNDKQKEADIITCAAPNFRTAHRYQSKSENDRVLEDRIHFMYQIAEENGVENLIAGAWGCGVFMQDPYTVATLLIGAARNYNIPNIYFATPRMKAGKECSFPCFYCFSFGKDSLGKQRSGIMYHVNVSLDTDLYHNWIIEAETKVAVEAAKELGMEEYKDYFLI